MQLNVFKPVIIKNVLQSIRLLSDGMVQTYPTSINLANEATCSISIIHEKLCSGHPSKRETYCSSPQRIVDAGYYPEQSSGLRQ